MMLNLPKQNKYLLACSYGPDSMALFQMLKNEGYHFDVAHIQYNLREDSKKECEDLLRYCAEQGIKCFAYKVEEKIERNIEERCREIRYEFFHKIYHEGNYSALLVAHHQDDLIETYLLQKQRNILPRYYGLQESSLLYDMRVIRPLLHYKKVDLMEFCKENNVPFALDYTNFLNIYARNKIRHEVVEKMNDEERKNIIEGINHENEILNKKYEALDRLEYLDNKGLLRLEDDLFRMFLTRLAKEVDPSFEVSKKVAREIRKVLEADKPNIIAHVSSSLVFVKEYDSCCFDLNEEVINYFYTIEEPSVVDNEYFYLNTTGDVSNRNIKADDYPLIIRNATKDDVYTILNYPVKVRRLFIDWKMPISLRKRWPIILNKDNKIIYIPRYQKDFVPNEQCNFYVKKRFSLKK